MRRMFLSWNPVYNRNQREFRSRPDRGLIRKAAGIKKDAQATYEEACRLAGKQAEKPEGPAQWTPAASREGLLNRHPISASFRPGLPLGRSRRSPGTADLRHQGLCRVCGSCLRARAKKTTGLCIHHEALDYLTQPNPAVDKLLELNLKCGEINLAVMEMLMPPTREPMEIRCRLGARHSGERQGDPCIGPRP